jgi:hypothetical protein
MKINIILYVFVPFNYMYVGGTNKPVFRKDTSIEINPDILSKIIRGFVPYDNRPCRIKKYDEVANIFSLSADMEHMTRECVESLLANGYIMLDDGVRHYPQYASTFTGLPAKV